MITVNNSLCDIPATGKVGNGVVVGDNPFTGVGVSS